MSWKLFELWLQKHNFMFLTFFGITAAYHSSNSAQEAADLTISAKNRRKMRIIDLNFQIKKLITLTCSGLPKAETFGRNRKFSAFGLRFRPPNIKSEYGRKLNFRLRLQKRKRKCNFLLWKLTVSQIHMLTSCPMGVPLLSSNCQKWIKKTKPYFSS